ESENGACDSAFQFCGPYFCSRGFRVTGNENTAPVKRRVKLRYFLGFWLFVLSAVAFLDRTNITIASPQISRQYGLNYQTLGWIFSAFLLGYASLQSPAGWLASRSGPRKVLTIGVLLWGVTTAATAMLPSRIEHA